MIARPTLVLAALATALVLPASASGAQRDGSQVFADVCSVCHASGRDGAPKLGDAKAWAPRAQRGLSSLTDAAIAGVRKMPPHGGKLDTTDLELRRAIAYMVNQSGGSWAEPIDRAHPAKARSGQEIVHAQCLNCHAYGQHGAPRMGDRKAWIGRAKDGFDSLVQSAIHGHGGMPARGGMADLTDAEMREAITYLFQTSVKESK